MYIILSPYDRLDFMVDFGPKKVDGVISFAHFGTPAIPLNDMGLSENRALRFDW